MRWRVRKPGARYRALLLWHRWFAWYPVRIPTKGRMSKMHYVWLEPVLRQGYHSPCNWEDNSLDWNYKEI